MRRWLLLLMVLLLPLRGWVGDALAGEMLQQHVAAEARQGQGERAPARAAHGHDCDEHGASQPAQAQPQVDPQAQPTQLGDCATCASCQVCSAVALWPPAAPAVLALLTQPQPHRGEPACTSAEPAHAFKPPRG